MDLPRELRSDRLYLRRWLESDREPFARLNADPRVVEYGDAPAEAGGWGATLVRLR